MMIHVGAHLETMGMFTNRLIVTLNSRFLLLSGLTHTVENKETLILQLSFNIQSEIGTDVRRLVFFKLLYVLFSAVRDTRSHHRLALKQIRAV